MKPATAAKKLGIYLPACPEEFQENALTHVQFRELQQNPPQWLQDLRREGPHPRAVVAQKLGVSITALKRNDADKPLTTAEIQELLAAKPAWLEAAREVHAAQRSADTATTSASSDAEGTASLEDDAATSANDAPQAAATTIESDPAHNEN
ncbi:MAG: DUF5997 family protein [Corynebacterium sp.]|nr:DUF5997 family protein [Corynebacterium sp.]